MATEGTKKSPLDTFANIAIIVVCAIAAVILIRNNFFPQQPQRPPGAPPQAEVGDTIPELKNVVPAGAERALVVAVSPTCGYCDQSIPFYKRLMEERDKKGSNVKVIAAVPSEDAKAEEAQKFASAGLKPDNLVSLDFATIKVPGTPTLLLVDNKGEVQKIWVGKQDAKGEKQILKEL
jgi:thiol-disulfide isomerase/thioredoxin